MAPGWCGYLLMFPILQKTYETARPDLAPAVIEGVIRAALERARAKHLDWSRFEPAIEFLAGVFFTDHARLPIDDYLETLYCAVKHGDFSRRWRALLRASEAPRAVQT
jgi:hypothetical protein